MEPPRFALVGNLASVSVQTLRLTFAGLGLAVEERPAVDDLKLLVPEGAISGFSAALNFINDKLRTGERQSPDSVDLAIAAVDSGHPAGQELRESPAGLPDAKLETASGSKIPHQKNSIRDVLLGNARLLRGLARLAARFAPPVITLGKSTFVFRWTDVASVCDRDGEFRIAPVNGTRIEDVSGPFILGMDRSDALFRQRQILYGALDAVDMATVRSVMEVEAERLIGVARQQFKRIDVVNSYARLVAGRVAVQLFGVAGPTEQHLLRVARAVFHETFLNPGADIAVKKAGIAAGQELNSWIIAEIAARRSGGIGKSDLLGGLLRAVAAGNITDSEAAHILSGLLVGSIDTTATCVANIMEELVGDKALCWRVHADADDRGRMWGWCLEILRRRPHNPLVLREAAPGASIAGKRIEPGNKVFAVTLSAMQDARVFDRPSRLDPLRPPENYMHFGRGLHLCSGRDLNAVQIPFLVSKLVRLNPTRAGLLKHRGPFPDELVVGLDGVPT